MKQRLTEESRTALIHYRLQRAKETLSEAEAMVEKGFYNAAVNRYYYACYYAVIALLLKIDITAQTHQGVKQMFALYYIRTGKIDNKYSQFYTQLFNDRISGDYDDFLLYDYDKLSQLRPEAEDFILTIEKELENIVES
ncbi:MAG: HEPN domain-containing protein [Candidatus Azobacteroides sp.]|nr:HEPN domain-containing protein [Candidatus Azobacteroides sp.]